MNGTDPAERRPPISAALTTTLILSLLLAWLPVLGPFFAGLLGGRRARRPATALVLGLLVGGAWTLALVLLSRREVPIGREIVSLGPLALLAPVFGLALLGGCLAGAAGAAARVGGVLALAASVALLAVQVSAVWGVVRQFRPTPVPAVPAQAGTCEEHLKKLYNAIMLYADGWDSTLPPADAWTTAVRPNVPDDGVLGCPRAPGGYGYAFNDALGGKRIDGFADRAATPLLRDSTETGPDAHEDFGSAPPDARHDGKANVLYLDGTVRSVSPGG
ncbi:MAG: hypothetical protein IT208_15320 [Chthonomonadales bacterium]|nr:hypothetical protein [Chthonomonadales bacterium]